MNKTLIFDMDGTLANFYGVANWLGYLENEDTTPYEIAAPLYEMNTLNSVLRIFKDHGWKIVVTSWASKNATNEFLKEIERAKIDWLMKYNFPFDEINVVEYGVDKSEVTKKYKGVQVLIDDDEEVRKQWSLGNTINPTPYLIADLMILLLESEVAPNGGIDFGA